jgi:hypothetical protein
VKFDQIRVPAALNASETSLYSRSTRKNGMDSSMETLAIK